jgi:CBS-domain-containing membrane protein
MKDRAARSPSAHTRKGPVDPTVSDVMTPGVVAAHQNATFKEIVQALVRNRVACVPVIDGDRKVIGVISESDLLGHLAGGGISAPGVRFRWATRSQHRVKQGGTSATELMSAPPITVKPDVGITEAARLAATQNVRRMPVVDDSGVLLGIVSRGDLLKTFLRADDEIRRDIVERVISERMAVDPSSIAVSVTEGIVELAGLLESRQLVNQLVAEVRTVPGVVAVCSSLAFPRQESFTPDLHTPLY